jgi:hypothetical protein
VKSSGKPFAITIHFKYSKEDLNRNEGLW